MKEKNKEISPIIYGAINIMERCFGGTKIEIIGDDMYRLSPTNEKKIGLLGIDIKINGVNVFLGCESMAEPICEYGEIVAEGFIFNVMKDAHPKRFKNNNNNGKKI